MRRLVVCVLVGLLTVGTAQAQNLGDVLIGLVDMGLQGLLSRTQVVGPQCAAAFGVAPLCAGATIELRADEGTFEQARQVEAAFQRVLQLNPDGAMAFALEDKQLQQLIEAGLKQAFARAGCSEVLTADELRQWTEQRHDERSNDEVRQGSLPARGTLERPLYVVRWRWVPVAGTSPNVMLSMATLRNVNELTAQLSLSVQLADSGLTVATFLVPVQVRAAGSMRGQSTYSRPFIHAMMTKATAYLGGMLVEQVRTWDKVCLGQLKLQVGPQSQDVKDAANAPIVAKLVPAQAPRYRVFAVYQRYAFLTCGQEDGLVGTNDGTGQPAGSTVLVGGNPVKLDRTARRLALIRLDGLPLEVQEAISRPDVPVTWAGRPAPSPAPVTSTSGAAATPAPSQSKPASVPVNVEVLE